MAACAGLDGVNLFLAGALSGFGPYVAVFLAGQNWPQQNIGFVLTAAGLLSQLPGCELLDRIHSKRLAVALGAMMVAAGALIIASWPSFWLVLHFAQHHTFTPLSRKPRPDGGIYGCRGGGLDRFALAVVSDARNQSGEREGAQMIAW